MHKCGLFRHAVSVCPSVLPSVMFVDHVKTNKRIFEIFSPSGSHTIQVFRTKRGGDTPTGTPCPPPLTGASNAGGVGKRRDSGRISGFAAYRSTVLSTVRVPMCEKQSRTNGGKRRALTAVSVVRCSHKRTTKCL